MQAYLGQQQMGAKPVRRHAAPLCSSIEAHRHSHLLACVGEASARHNAVIPCQVHTTQLLTF